MKQRLFQTKNILHQSTLRKVDVFADLLDRAIQGTLKVRSKWKDIYGISIQGFFNFCQDKWWIKLIISIVLLILGGIVGVFFDRISP